MNDIYSKTHTEVMTVYKVGKTNAKNNSEYNVAKVKVNL